MKKTSLLTFIAILATMQLTAQEVSSKNLLTETELSTLKSKVKTLQNPSLEVTQGVNLGNVTFVEIKAMSKTKVRTINGFVDNKTNAIYIGGGYDAKGLQITFPASKTKSKSPAFYKEGLNPKDAYVITDNTCPDCRDFGANIKDIENSIIFTKGTGPKHLYVITDPECPYCRDFEAASEGKLDEYTIHYILMPLSFHNEAKPMTNYILNAKDDAEKAERLSAVMTGGVKTHYKKYTDDKLKDLISEYMTQSGKAVTELGVTGTPSFFIKSEDNSTLVKTDWGTLLKLNK